MIDWLILEGHVICAAVSVTAAVVAVSAAIATRRSRTEAEAAAAEMNGLRRLAGQYVEHR